MPPGANPIEDRSIHFQFGHPGIGELRIGVAFEAATIEEQLASEPELGRLLQFWRDGMSERREGNRTGERRLFGPRQADQGVTFFRGDEGGFEGVWALIELNG